MNNQYKPLNPNHRGSKQDRILWMVLYLHYSIDPLEFPNPAYFSFLMEFESKCSFSFVELVQNSAKESLLDEDRYFFSKLEWG